MNPSSHCSFFVSVILFSATTTVCLPDWRARRKKANPLPPPPTSHSTPQTRLLSSRFVFALWIMDRCKVSFLCDYFLTPKHRHRHRQSVHGVASPRRLRPQCLAQAQQQSPACHSNLISFHIISLVKGQLPYTNVWHACWKFNHHHGNKWNRSQG